VGGCGIHQLSRARRGWLTHTGSGSLLNPTRINEQQQTAKSNNRRCAHLEQESPRMMRAADPPRAVACFIPREMRLGADGSREAQRELKGALLGRIRSRSQGPFLHGSD
jgi:hypothetical protein